MSSQATAPQQNPVERAVALRRTAARRIKGPTVCEITQKSSDNVCVDAHLCEEEPGASAVFELSRAADLSGGCSGSGDACCMPQRSC